MAPCNTPEDSLKYLMLILKNTEKNKPNYQEVAKEAGINNANNAQKRFKKIVEEAGFVLSDGKVVLPDGDTVNTPTKPTTPRGRKKTVTPASKKRKIAAEEEEGIKQENFVNRLMEESPEDPVKEESTESCQGTGSAPVEM